MNNNDLKIIPRELTFKRVTTIDNPFAPQKIFAEYKGEKNPKAQYLNCYDPFFYQFLRHKFPGAEKIQRNYSGVMHDMFILSALNGKRDGTYVEIGGGLPCIGNNTWLLESEFNWRGISFDLDKEEKVDLYNKIRRNKCFCENACTLDVDKFLIENNLGPHIDYLQIDIDPANQSLQALKNIPLDKYSFSIIHFEHEFCHNNNEYFGNSAYEYLTSHGYKLAVKNLHDASEDWYYNPNTVDLDIMSKLIREETFVPYQLGYDSSKQIYFDNFLWGHEIILDLPHDISPLIETGYNLTSYDLRNSFSV
jgi:hypothetical protein